MEPEEVGGEKNQLKTYFHLNVVENSFCGNFNILIMRKPFLLQLRPARLEFLLSSYLAFLRRRVGVL